jgi:ribosomal protein S18 acetylase RimI-like enzyme
MTASNPTASRSTRALKVDDLERVIAIDRILSGRSRRHFFEKRFANAHARPNDFVQVGVVTGDRLQGFVIARILRGEFGQKDAVAVLDAVGVDPQSQEHGLGQILMEGLVDISRQRGVQSLQSHVSWTSVDLLRFFNASNFKLAPRLDLERPVTELREVADEEP